MILILINRESGFWQNIYFPCQITLQKKIRVSAAAWCDVRINSDLKKTALNEYKTVFGMVPLELQ
jgi:hypothetical protein